MNNVWARGTRLPILVGIPGIVPRAKLMRVSAKIGIGESLRYLRKHNDFVTRFLRPGGFSPDRLIKGLQPLLGGPEEKVGGFHIFTFNELAETEAWRQRKLSAGEAASETGTTSSSSAAALPAARSRTGSAPTPRRACSCSRPGVPTTSGTSSSTCRRG